MQFNKRIYFDHNATTHPLPEALKIAVALMPKALNASAQHSSGKEAKKILEESRLKILNSLNADTNQYTLFFTATATEANNLILNSFNNKVSSDIEHPSILNAFQFNDIKAYENGVVDIFSVKSYFERVEQLNCLVSIMCVNNEIGTIQPIKKIANYVHNKNGFIHSDAVQALGKIYLDINDLQVDAITISAHKIGGIKGAAALIIRKNLLSNLKPLYVGGGQEAQIHPGTENIAAIAAFAKAVEIVQANVSNYNKEVAKLRNYLEAEILKICPEVQILGKDAARVANTSYINMPNVNSNVQIMHFDLYGISVSAGSACSMGRVSIPHVAMAIGLSENKANEFIRVSLGKNNTLEEINEFIKIWQHLYKINNQQKNYG